jgi:hypothetical protein
VSHFWGALQVEFNSGYKTKANIPIAISALNDGERPVCAPVPRDADFAKSLLFHCRRANRRIGVKKKDSPANQSLAVDSLLHVGVE